MTKNKYYTSIFLVFVFSFTNAQAQPIQQNSAYTQAYEYFEKENYSSAIALCYESKKYPPKESILLANLTRSTLQCSNLLKTNCDIPSYEQIKKIRLERYSLTNSPIIDKKITECKNPPEKPQNTKPVPKVETNPKQHTAKGSAPLTDTVQLKIIYNFLNQFADAFTNRNIKFIDMVFSNKAVIITETNIYTTGKNGKKIKDENKSKKTREGKQEYLDKLYKEFEKKNPIYVNFDKIEICRSMQNPNIYGINLLQIWLSESNFVESGVGWVFLNIDFNDINEPTIWVKTWQNIETEKDDRYYLDSVIE